VLHASSSFDLADSACQQTILFSLCFCVSPRVYLLHCSFSEPTTCIFKSARRWQSIRLDLIQTERRRGVSSPCSRAKVDSPHRFMNRGDSGVESKGEQDEGLLYFSFPGLLPDDSTLMVNPAKRTVILLRNEASGRARVVTQQFSPNGMRLLVPLFQAYPDYCPYDVLLSSLFPLSLEEGRKHLQEAWATTIRPVRRAIGSSMAGLAAFGLKVHSIRGLGYILKPL